jgi:hypothetical protein
MRIGEVLRVPSVDDSEELLDDVTADGLVESADEAGAGSAPSEGLLIKRIACWFEG